MDILEFLSTHQYAETTKRTYQSALKQIFTGLDPASLTAADLITIIQSKGWGNKRQCVALAAAQQFLRWKFGNHPALSAKIKRLASRPQRALDEKTALLLLASFNPHSPKGARDLAIASLMLDTGLRAAEICNLEQACTDTEHGTLQVIVKGGQWSAAVFSTETALRIEDWKSYRQQIGGLTWLFCNINTGKKLTPEGLFKIVRLWGEYIGVTLSPHDLRRSFAVLSTTLTNTPERVLMEGGRWKSSQMILNYTRTIRLESMRKHLIIPALRKKD